MFRDFFEADILRSTTTPPETKIQLVINNKEKSPRDTSLYILLPLLLIYI